MLLDILSDRGFSGAYIVNERIIPARIDPDTWEVKNEVNLIHKFRCFPPVAAQSCAWPPQSDRQLVHWRQRVESLTCQPALTAHVHRALWSSLSLDGVQPDGLDIARTVSGMRC
jgi:hypothetical protein